MIGRSLPGHPSRPYAPTNGSSKRHPRHRSAIGHAVLAAAALGGLGLPSGPSVAADPIIRTVAGTGEPALTGAAGKVAEFNIGQPFGVEMGPDGLLYVTEVQNHRVLAVDVNNGRIETVAGTGRAGYSGDGGPATEALLNEPYEVRFDADGHMYFVEMRNHLIRCVDARTGVIRTVAGTGQPGDSGDGGPAVRARFRQPHSIALDGRGRLYVADIGNHRIRRVDLRRGIVQTIAGTGERVLPEDGQTALGNPILGPRALAIDGDDLWIALREGHSVWRLALSQGTLQHVAGCGDKGYSGDGGPAIEATFNGPKGIAKGPDRAVYVVDTENQVIRRIDLATGSITTVAGNGKRGGGGDGGPACRAALARPHGICVAADGTIYIGDTENHRVRAVLSVGAE